MTMPNGGALPAMPPGIAQPQSNPASTTPNTAPATTAVQGFTPPFQLVKGKPGVYTDPRLQIAGGGNASTNTVAPTATGGTGPPAAGNIGGTGALNGGGDSSNSSPLPSGTPYGGGQ